jgi:hypothetical protein
MVDTADTYSPTAIIRRSTANFYPSFLKGMQIYNEKCRKMTVVEK